MWFLLFRKGRIDIYLLGNRFVYDGINSSRYNLSILRIDTDGLTSAEGSVEYSSSFFPAQNKRYITGVSRESAPLEFEVEIIGEEGYCSVHERAIKNWLFNSPTFKELYIDPEDDKEAEYVNGTIKRQYLECVFCNPEKIEYAEGIGHFCPIGLTAYRVSRDRMHRSPSTWQKRSVCFSVTRKASKRDSISYKSKKRGTIQT